MKILFNCLVYHKNDIIKDNINNIKKFVKDPIICFHVNPKFASCQCCSGEIFDDSIKNIDNVYINPNQHEIELYGNKTRALYSNHEYISKELNINFDYEVIFYPKMLLAKKNIEEYLKDVDAVLNIDNILSENSHLTFNISRKIFPKGLVSSLVESIIFSKKIGDQSFEYLKNNNLLDVDGWCSEETILPTAIYHYSNKIKKPIFTCLPNREMNLEILLKVISNQGVIPHQLGFEQKTEDVFVVYDCSYDINNPVREYLRKTL